ncbi:cytochrome c oxidase assembly protein COX16 homolog, mitochondrial [Nematostella vectensis]|uniref:cytochrome c oxidase assembly protein COX16 homolog, mitochondrial n=1 Tax=Nematostella vectensis TaxID=45351 RepID=UPI00138FE975|nr:cytochrome c oxidase assembly protein COX16 homolog, mitochondrial [Nematostella vectensis]
MAAGFLSSLSRTQRRFLRFGVPMLVLVVGGSLGLKEFTDIKIKRRDTKFQKLTKEEALKVLPKREKQITLEDAYTEIAKEVDIDRWENKRGPRPWEESK